MDDEGPRAGMLTGALTKANSTVERRAWLAFPHAVVKKYGEDRGGYLAALIAYYGFFSLFPLLLLLVTVLGYVLEGNPELQEDIVNSAITQFPVVGDQISENVGSLEGNLLALVIGIVGTLWAGLGSLQAMEHAMSTVWCVPMADRPNFLVAKLRALAMLPVLGVGTIGVALLGGVGTVTGVLGLVGAVVGGLLAVLLATSVFLLGFCFLTNRDLPWTAHLPGAVLAGVLFVMLHIVGGFYVDRAIRGATQTYGVFAVVIGLLSWMALQAQFGVVAAEVNVVRHDRLWPRRLPGVPEDTEAGPEDTETGTEMSADQPVETTYRERSA